MAEIFQITRKINFKKIKFELEKKLQIPKDKIRIKGDENKSVITIDYSPINYKNIWKIIEEHEYVDVWVKPSTLRVIERNTMDSKKDLQKEILGDEIEIEVAEEDKEEIKDTVDEFTDGLMGAFQKTLMKNQVKMFAMKKEILAKNAELEKTMQQIEENILQSENSFAELKKSFQKKFSEKESKIVALEKKVSTMQNALKLASGS